MQADERLRLLGKSVAGRRAKVLDTPPGHVGDDESFEAFLRGVGFHAAASHPFARRVSKAMPIWRGEKRFLRSFQA